ncbi:hypothetical protein PIB30_059815 [Stylosanthes scabra]|uniref:RNase H type-1 domain-containing protein n=1 Tax=Stylosanthes scabra TaxID=79078 RepID=A0ABU6RL81_9FABA|nr:hypothetical protein [Stylosanthes scabra]
MGNLRAIEAEMLAVLEGLKLAWRKGCKFLVVECENEGVDFLGEEDILDGVQAYANNLQGRLLAYRNFSLGWRRALLGCSKDFVLDIRRQMEEEGSEGVPSWNFLHKFNFVVTGKNAHIIKAKIYIYGDMELKNNMKIAGPNKRLVEIGLRYERIGICYEGVDSRDEVDVPSLDMVVFNFAMILEGKQLLLIGKNVKQGSYSTTMKSQTVPWVSSVDTQGDMRLLLWNYQLGRPLTIHNFKGMSKSHFLKLGFLCETKNQARQVELKLQFLGFSKDPTAAVEDAVLMGNCALIAVYLSTDEQICLHQFLELEPQIHQFNVGSFGGFGMSESKRKLEVAYHDEELY